MSFRPFFVLCVIAGGLSAPAFGVGILQKLDVEVRQGSVVVFQKSGIDPTGNPLDGTVAADLGPLSWDPATNAKLWITLNDPTTPDVVNRWVAFRIDTGNSYLGNSLLDPSAEGELTVTFSNMLFTKPNPALTPAPITPQDYVNVGKGYLPILYIMSNEGFLNLEGGERYGPNQPAPWNIAGAATPRSVQTPLSVWTSGNPYGYAFTDLTSGLVTGYRLAGIQDTSGTNPLRADAPTVTYIDNNSPNDFFPGVYVQTVPGIVPEIGSCLEFYDVPVPEPITVLLLMGGLVWMRPRRHNSVSGRSS